MGNLLLNMKLKICALLGLIASACGHQVANNSTIVEHAKDAFEKEEKDCEIFGDE